MLEELIAFIRSIFGVADGFIPLHAPFFGGNEKAYVADTIDSTFVSSVGSYVNKFEAELAEYTGAKYAVAMANGTAALHLSLLACGVRPGDEVLTQPLTFVATANAIRHAGAHPVFLDVELDTLGLSPDALDEFLATNAVTKEGACINKSTGRRIAACVPMHTFGFPLRVDTIVGICERYCIPVVEDAAESLGSFYKGHHTGTFGLVGTLSFNGNKIITTGGGGAIITNDESTAKRLKHLSTTAKVPHQWEFVHDEVGYNYRMPNLNAALGCAQLEQLDAFVANKRALAGLYREYTGRNGIGFVGAIEEAHANCWLNAIVLKDREERDAFLQMSNDKMVMTRPIWKLMNELEMYRSCQSGELKNARWLEDRVVNVPSSVRQV